MSEQMPDAAAPPYGLPPQSAPAADLNEPRRMSPFARLLNVFFSPGEVFEDVRRSPRDWWLPMIALVLLATGAGYAAQWRLNLTPEALARSAIDLGLQQQGKTRKDLSPQEQQQWQQAEQFWTVWMRFAPLVALVLLPVGMAIIAGLYRLILLVAQGQTTFFRVLSVVAYSYFVPGAIKSLLQVVLAFIRQPGDVEPMTYLQNSGLIQASPAAFVSPTQNPALFSFLSYFDVFSIWYLILASIGIAAVCRKMKVGTAAMVVVTPYILLMVVSTLWAFAMAP